MASIEHVTARTSNFLRNQWYCAGWFRSLEEKPIGLTMLGEYVVIYADPVGAPIAVSGRCPHRFAPLDRGIVIGDRIMCPYHGLQFGRDGQCVANPSGPVPPRAALKTYPVVVRNRALWVWMGDPKRADVGRLPPDGFMLDSDYATHTLYLRVRANYQIVIDNLLDLNHAPFLHANTLAPPADGGPPKMPRHEYAVDGDVIHSNYYMDQAPPSPQMSSLYTDPLGAFAAEMTWRAPATLDLVVSLKPFPGGQARALHMPSVHYLTPESETTTHYFAAIGRNQKLGDVEEDRRMIHFLEKAFVEEDEPMLRACQDLMGTTDLFALDPIILKSDAAAIQARRTIERLKVAETSADSHIVSPGYGGREP